MSKLILKVGGSTLGFKERPHQLNYDRIERLGQEVGGLVAAGFGLVVVSSGGRRYGWEKVYDAWQQSIPTYTKNFLLDEAGLYSPDTQRMLFNVVESQAVPILNMDNSTLPVHSRLHNNDEAARDVALQAHERYPGMVQLGMLTDVEGVFGENGKVIPHVLDWGQVAHVGGSESPHAEGGMRTKIDAIASCGIRAWIADGAEKDVLQNAITYHSGTHFSPEGFRV